MSSAFLYCLRARDQEGNLLACWVYQSYDECASHMEEFVARWGWVPGVNIRIVQK